MPYGMQALRGVQMREFSLMQGEAGVWYGVFPTLLAAGVKHGFSARMGGCSDLQYASLNLALHVDDVEERVLANRRRFAAGLQMDAAALVAVNQIHGDRVLVATQGDAGKGAFSQTAVLGDADALITAEVELPLAMFFADCVPLLIYDSLRKVLGLAHAGWKGTAQEIGRRTLERMQETYGTKPEDCWLAIGPSIHSCCYQVGAAVAQQFPAACTTRRNESEWQLDLQLANRLQAIEGGIRPERIMESGVCTCCNRETFFSYRADKGRSGRMALFASLKET